MILATLLAGLAIAVGLVGIVVPVLPGTVLVLVAIAGWAWYVGTGLAWGVLALGFVLVAAGLVVKYAVPGRRLRTAGVPGSTLWAGGLLGVVGFFVVPVVGLLVGFVAGVLLAELRRVGPARARATTGHAVRAVALSVGLELAAALAATLVWAVGAVLVHSGAG